MVKDTDMNTEATRSCGACIRSPFSSSGTFSFLYSFLHSLYFYSPFLLLSSTSSLFYYLLFPLNSPLFFPSLIFLTFSPIFFHSSLPFQSSVYLSFLSFFPFPRSSSSSQHLPTPFHSHYFLPFFLPLTPLILPSLTLTLFSSLF